MHRENLFTEWLGTGTSSYWISGKPGSGKSSLTSYIFHRLEQEVARLPRIREWAGPQGIRLIGFWFFRPASTPLLKSLQGFWRTICFALLDIDDALPDFIRSNQDGTAPSSLRSSLLPRGSNAESWTDLELESWARYHIAHSCFSYFLLVDGLDEIEGDRGQLAAAIETMSVEHSNLKICCASPAESPFIEALSTFAALKLHEVNYHDIHEDCMSQLSGTRAGEFTNRISERSEGVFLRASLVTRDLARASKRGASLDDLRTRFEESSEEMGDLFDPMLRRIDKYYRRRPKPYLRLLEYAAHQRTSLYLFDLVVSSLPEFQRPDFGKGMFDQSYMTFLNDRIHSSWLEVEDACAGLVQCSTYLSASTLDIESTADFPEVYKALNTDVFFIHASVLDFLRRIGPLERISRAVPSPTKKPLPS